jgi:acyl-CoA dehydrogenase
MADRSFPYWPFFEDRHRDLWERLDTWCQSELAHEWDEPDVDEYCKQMVSVLGEAGWLRYATPESGLDVRSLCLIREAFAYRDGLADFSFALQGLGSGPIQLFGTPEQKQRLEGIRAGTSIPAFALSEPDAGSDVAAIATTAEDQGDHYVIDGTKTWISNGGIADFYIVFARTGEAPGAKGLSAFIVDADTPGLLMTNWIPVMAPHPLTTINFDACKVPKANLVGKTGEGFKIAMATLDVFRPTVGAAALGFARRALDEALNHTTRRHLFGAPMADMQITQAKLGEMATAIDASALLVYRAAWAKDQGAPRITREAAMAKYFATEEAQKVIDKAVQMFGALGVTCGVPVEQLYREIRALRIYEGASEVQLQIIARQLLKEWGELEGNLDD